MEAMCGTESFAPPKENQSLQGNIEYDVLLRCPRCSGDVNSFRCLQCDFRLDSDRGIIHAFPSERKAHYDTFIEDYERIRYQEGRGSDTSEFYLNLPFRDVSGRNESQWQIRSRSFACLMNRVLLPRLPAGARILDLGAGNCWLSFRLALAGYYSVAVDLILNERDGLSAAEHFRGHLTSLFPRVCAEVANLPFQSEQFDAAIFNASFHYAEDGEETLREALRCVKPGGFVILCDTPWYSSESAGNRMISERKAHFSTQYGTASASLKSVEFLTDGRLSRLEDRLQIRWKTDFPSYGLRWTMRPILANLRGKREPARFRIYSAQKVSA